MTRSQPSPMPTEPASGAQGKELGRVAARAAAFLVGGYGTAQILRLIGNVILTRLLFPEAFGLMGQVMVFLLGLHLFSDIGIGPSIVQSKRGGDPTYLNTAWTIQIFRGFALWMIGLAAAYPFAAFYQKPNLGPLLLAAGTTSIITGFQSTKINLAARNLNQRYIAALDLAGQMCALIVTVSLAYAYHSIWALVVGSLFGDVVRTVVSHLFLPGPRNRLAYDKESARSLIRFGRWIFVSTLLMFLVTYSDRLIYPKLVDGRTFGVYQTGANIAALAPAMLTILAGHILFPVYSRIFQSGADLRRLFPDIRRPLLVIGGWVLSGFAAGGPAAVRLLYDERYHGAGWAVQLLGIGAWFALLESTNTQALLAQGQSKLMAAANLTKLAGICVCVPIGFHLIGFEGAVMGYAAADACKYSFSAVAARKSGLRGLRQDLLFSAWFVAAALLGNLAFRIALSSTGVPVVEAVAVFLAVSLVWLPRAKGVKLPKLAVAPGAETGAVDAIPAGAASAAADGAGSATGGGRLAS